ncbi:hypothetical protein D3C86_1195670 [compost metagenome]
MAKQAHYGEGRHRFADDDDKDGCQHRQRFAQQDGGVKQHAHRDEEEHGEGILQWQGIVGSLVAEVGAVHHYPGEEGAEGEGDPEQLDRPEGDTQGAGEHGQGKEFARAGGGGAGQHPGDEAAAPYGHQCDEGGHLGQGEAQIPEHMGQGQGLASSLQVRQYGEQHQGQHHHQILDDEPADGDAPLLGIQLPPALQRPQQHHCAGGGECQPEHQAGGDAPAEQLGETEPEQGRQGDLHYGARDGDVFDREQILQGEVQADAKHQQNDADLRQFGGESQIGHIAGGEWAAHDPGRQITHHGGDAQALSQHAKEIGEHEAANQGCDKGE